MDARKYIEYRLFDFLCLKQWDATPGARPTNAQHEFGRTQNGAGRQGGPNQDSFLVLHEPESRVLALDSCEYCFVAVFAGVSSSAYVRFSGRSRHVVPDAPRAHLRLYPKTGLDCSRSGIGPGEGAGPGFGSGLTLDRRDSRGDRP